MKMTMGNALSNSAMHGEPEGPVRIVLSVEANRLQVTIVNRAGTKHAEIKRLQAQHGPNYLLDQQKPGFVSDIGSQAVYIIVTNFDYWDKDFREFFDPSNFFFEPRRIKA